MIRVACPHCQTKYRFDESQLGGKSRAQAKCKKCGGTIDITSAEAMAPRGSSLDGPPSDPANEDTTARVKKLRSDEPVGEETITGPAVA